MAEYSAASSNWRNAKPTVRNNAKISKPSKVQPRFEAINTFHCARLKLRYQGSDNTASLLDMAGLPPVFTVASVFCRKRSQASCHSIGGGTAERQQARAWLSCDRRRDPAGVHPLDPVSAQAKPGDGLCTITVIPGAERLEAARNPCTQASGIWVPG